MPPFTPAMGSREADAEFARCDFAHFNVCGSGGTIPLRFVASPTLSPKRKAVIRPPDGGFSFVGTCWSSPSLTALQWRLAMQKEGNHVVETAVEARAGFLDRPVLVVLAVGCVLAIGVLGVVFAGFFK